MFNQRVFSFLRIAELGSFAQAAESLFISPAALSQQIKKLEQELGFPLFDRRCRSAKLTVAGQQFLPVAQQLVQTYENALVQCRITAEMERNHRPYLRIGFVNDDALTVWAKCMELMEKEDLLEVCPRAARYPSRMELYRALLRGEEEFSILLENEELYSLGLQFHPLTTIPEVCQLFLPPPELQAKESLTIDDLLQNRVAFHCEAGNTIYEDALRAHLQTLHPGIYLGEPQNFFHTKHKTVSTLILVPGTQYAGERRYARPLVWGEGIRLGFVTTQTPKPEAEEYIRQMQAAVQRHPELWEV